MSSDDDRKRRRKRKRKRKRKREPGRKRDRTGLPAVIGARGATMAVRVDIEALELARGHDGFLRGAPEPVIALGLYTASEERVELVSRTTWRFSPPTRFPCTVAPRGGDEIAVRVARATPVIALAFAIERDSGAGVQTLYGALERPDAITLWSHDGAVPVPRTLDEVGTEAGEWTQPVRVHALVDGRDVGALCTGDDWVDAALLVLTAPGRARVHVRSEDGRNDWTAVLVARGW